MIKWNENLWLFTVDEYNQLPDGIVLTSIGGDTATKGVDYIDMDVRFGHIAYGINGPLLNHPESELLMKLKLSV